MKQTTQTDKKEERDIKRIGVSSTSLRSFKGCRINDDETPKALDMELNDVIEAYKSTESTTVDLQPKSPNSPGADSSPQERDLVHRDGKITI